MKQIVPDQNQKAIETFSLMANKEDVDEFKKVFKEKFQKDWSDIQDEVKDEPTQGNLSAPEEFLEKLFQEHYEKISD